MIMVALFLPGLILRADLPLPPGSISLAWSPSPAAGVIGYQVHYGLVGDNVTNITALYDSTNATLIGLQPGIPYFFFVTACNEDLVESLPSNFINDTPVPCASAGTNTPPLLMPAGDQTVTAGSPLAFTATATDPDVPCQTLAFSLDAGAPAGASIDPASGAFTWTPALAQGGTVCSVTVRVTDNGVPALSDTQTISITVNPPVAPPAPSLTGSAGSAVGTVVLTWDASQDAAVVGYKIYYGIVGSGVTNATALIPATTATLNNLQGGASYFFCLTAVDDLSLESPPSNLVTATPAGAGGSTNPVLHLASIGNQTVVAGSLLTLMVTATGAGLPGQTLSYSLDPGAPAGANLNPVAGTFYWVPGVELGGTTCQVTFRVTDNSTPPQSDTQTITITIASANQPPAPSLSGSAASTPGTVALTWTPAPAGHVIGNVVYYGEAGSGVTNAFSRDGVSGVVVPDLQPGVSYFFFVTAYDNHYVESLPSNPITVTPAPALSLATIANQTVTVGNVLIVTMVGDDLNAPMQPHGQNLKAAPAGPQLAYSLDAAPAGATIDPATGLLRWRPTREQAGTTNLFTVRVSDGNTPPSSATQSFTVTVPHYLSVDFGSTIVFAGGQISVPVNVYSSASVTGLTFTVDFPSDRLTNLVVGSLGPGTCSSSVTPISPGRALVTLGTCAGQAVQNTQQMAVLQFAATAGQSSSFVPLTIQNLAAVRADASPIPCVEAGTSRVVLIANEPLLETTRGTNGQLGVVLYGLPGRSYQLESAGSLAAATWTPAVVWPLTNSSQAFSLDSGTQPGAVFYRVRQQ